MKTVMMRKVLKRSLQGSVGHMGRNWPDDVALITDLLNGVSESLGGPSDTLQKTSVRDLALGCNVELMNAISSFQQKHFGWGKAVIEADSATLYKLFQLSPAGDGGQGGVTVIPGGRRAQNIDEARKWVGKVGDKGEPKKRRGSDILKRIFDEGMLGPIAWNGPAQTYVDINHNSHQVTPIQGLEVPGMRIPQGNGLGMNWCGIFAAWCWRNAGTDVQWKRGGGGGPTLKGSATPLELSTNFGALTPGDICFIPESQHHFILVAVNDNKSLATIEGNSLYQEIDEFKDKRKIADLVGFYSFDTAMNQRVFYKGATRKSTSPSM